MVVLEDVSWKSGIKWAIATAVGGMIIAIPLVVVLAALKVAVTPPEFRAGSRGVEVAVPIKGRYEITAKR